MKEFHSRLSGGLVIHAGRMRPVITVSWTIEHRAVFDFLAHPSCLYVTDPEFRTIDLICDLVQKSPDKVEFADLDRISRCVAESTKK